MALLLYTFTATVLLVLANRYIAVIPRWVMAVLFALPFAFVGKALLTGGVYAPIDLPYLSEPLASMRLALGVPRPHNGYLSDLYAQTIPWRKALQYALSRHEWPLWNPFIFSGDLLAGTAQPAAYSPFMLLGCLLPIAQGMTFSAAISFFIAAVSAFVFLKDLGIRDSVALFGATGWMYAKALVFFILFSIGASWTLFPLILLGARRVVREPSVRSAAILIAGLVLFMFSGHPESVVHAVVIGSAYGLFELLRTRRETVRGLATAIAAGLVALGLSAIYLMPLLDGAQQTVEFAWRTGGWRHVTHGVELPEVGARMLTDLFPFLHYAVWQVAGLRVLQPDTAAVGSILLAFALVAAFRVRSADKWFWLGVAVLGFLARSGWPPLADSLARLPLVGMIVNERFAYPAIFALVVLATLAIEQLLARDEWRPAVYVTATALALLTIGQVWIDHAALVKYDLTEWGIYARFAELSALSVVVLLLIVRPRGLVLLLTLCLLGQHFLEHGDTYPTLPAAIAYPKIPILEPLARIKTPFRIVGVGGAFVPGTSTLYELEDARGYEALTFLRYVATYPLWCVDQPVWFNRVDDLTKPFLSFLNVRYAISSSRHATPAGWHVVATQRGSKLLENEHVLPRVFIPRRVRVGFSGESRNREMAQESDFAERAWIEADLPDQDLANGTGIVTFERQHNDLLIEAQMQANGWLVISEPAWNGWRAYLDGRRVRTQFANHAFIAVHVPAGKHSVRLTFLPDSFVRGRAISSITVAGVVLLGLVMRLRKRRAA